MNFKRINKLSVASRLIPMIAIVGIAFVVYFGTATKFSFHPKWTLDYFNPMAQSMLNGRLDLIHPADTYDLVQYQSRWYAPWGILPALVLMVPQLVLGRFTPSLYVSLLFASFDIVLVYLLLCRMKEEFLPLLTNKNIILLLFLFAFGTTHYYVGTLGSVWHVDQMVSSFFGTLGIYTIFKKKRSNADYLLSVIFFGVTLMGRATIVLLVLIPATLFVWDNAGKFFLSGFSNKVFVLTKMALIFVVPLGIFCLWFFYYNFVRFDHPFEYGYRYIHESEYLAQLRLSHGIMSLSNIPRNAWFMLFEIPHISYIKGIKIDINLNGNSIFFLTPPFFSAFLATPIVKRKKKWHIDPYIIALWVAAVVTILPSLMIYSTGWMQFGYRYSLDITVLLLLLTTFGMRGRITRLFTIGIVFSIVMHIVGISLLT